MKNILLTGGARLYWLNIVKWSECRNAVAAATTNPLVR